MLEEWLYLQPPGKNKGRRMDGEMGGWDTEGKLKRRRRATESEWKVREDSKRRRAGG